MIPVPTDEDRNVNLTYAYESKLPLTSTSIVRSLVRRVAHAERELARAASVPSGWTYRDACINGTRVRCRIRDTDLSRRTLWEDVLQGLSYPLMPPQIQEKHPVRRIIDIGANVGLASLYFHSAYPNAMIEAYEPDPVNFAAAKDNTRQFPNIHLYPWGIGPLTETAKFYQSTVDGCCSSLCPTWVNCPPGQDAGVVEIDTPMTGIDDFLESETETIDILKVDAEGIELMVVEALIQKHLAHEEIAKRFPLGDNTWPLPKVLYLEFHDFNHFKRILELTGPHYTIAHARIQNPMQGEVAFCRNDVFQDAFFLGHDQGQQAS